MDGDYSRLKEGLDDKYTRIVDETIGEMHKTKMTSNDIVYVETKKKLLKTLKK